ncbi:ScyD/ScyE family protein [Kineococcus gynurae]|uniref:ScyD/ScyE family protein n=1 Tax=Kineococcus gynurae TaxID=452979 RepID=A0ABV5LPV3_9ACTN
MRHRFGAAVISLVAAVSVGAAPAQAKDDPPAVQVVADGLDGAFGLSFRYGRFYVAEPISGEITAIRRDGRQEVWASGFAGPTGVDRVYGRLLVVTGGPQDGTPVPGAATLFHARRNAPTQTIADLQAYELAANPDGQTQFGPDGAALDALSNPVSVLAGRWRGQPTYVADGGGNDVLQVAADGTVSTFFVPPTVTTGACEGRPNNDEASTGCDSVPTGLAWGPDGNLYVSTLSGEAPGEGLVYVLDPRTAEVVRTVGGLDSPTGVAVGDDGEIYVSQILEGAPAGDPEQPPPPDFDPSTVGQITRIDPDGSLATAQVTQPLGLRVVDGELYSTAWSIAGPGLGQVVRVGEKAFVEVDD